MNKEIGRVVWVDSDVRTDLGLVARIKCRMESGESRLFYVTRTEPYMFVPEHAPVPDFDFIDRVEHGFESVFDEKLKKIITDEPEQIRGNDMCLVDYYDDKGFDHFEADLPYYRRLSIHDSLSGYIAVPEESDLERNGVEVIDINSIDTDPDFEKNIEPRVMISDIEVRVSDDETFKETRRRGSQPINVICSYDTYEEDYVVFFYDKHGSLQNTDKIREHVRQHWSGNNSQFDHYADVDIELRYHTAEEDMLNEYINYINKRDFDLTSGWNWTDFDTQYSYQRMKTLDDVNPHRMCPFGFADARRRNNMMTFTGRASFDMMEAFCDVMTFTNWRSHSLDYVANEELGVGKVDDVDINEAWKNDPEKLIGYNIIDVALTVALDEANDIHGFFYEVADVCSIPIYDTFYEKRQVDGYVLSRRRKDEIFPSGKETEDIENAGGYVEDPVNGRKEDIGVSDLKSLYPSTMITWNMSTETIAESPDEFDEYVKVPKVPEPKNVEGEIREEDIEWDWLYCSMDKEGVIPRILRKLFRKRNYEKKQRNKYEPESPMYKMWDRKQAATKVIMNSFYGNSSSKYWRGSNRNGKYLGDATTSGARYTLWKGKQSIKDAGYVGAYGDTDSHFIELTEESLEDQITELEEISAKMDEDASDIAQEIGIEGKHPFLEDSELHGDDYTCMKWEPEKIYDVWMQLGTKKRYAGSIVWKEGKYYDEPKISISGFEFRRADSMEVTAEMQQKVIEMILKGAGFEEVSEYIQGVISRIDEDYENIKEFALPGSINKPLHEYPNRQVPRASEYSNEHLGYEFGEGDDPFVYFVKRTPSDVPATDVVAFEWNEEIPEGFELDEEAIIERGIKKPIDSIINEVDWKFSELRTGQKQKTEGLGSLGSTNNPFA